MHIPGPGERHLTYLRMNPVRYLTMVAGQVLAGGVVLVALPFLAMRNMFRS